VTDPTGGWGWLIAAAAIVTALVTIWKVVWPFLRLLVAADKFLPVLFTIAAEFQTNGGKSLKDQLNRIEDTLKSMNGTVTENEVTLRQLYDYSHNARHDLLSHVTSASGRIELAERRVGRLEGEVFGPHYRAPERLEDHPKEGE
jgi:hypothetical protein